MEPFVKEGLRVRVPFGRAEQTGYITALNTNPKLPKNIKLKEIKEILDDKLYYGSELMPLANFIETTYANTLGQTLEVMLPSFINKKLMAGYQSEPQENLPLFYPAGPLTESQKLAIKTAEENQITLFCGDTFSGKSEAVLHLTHKALSQNGQVLILVPDIISSSEFIKTVQDKFGLPYIHMWHSKVPLSKRKIAAADILSGKPCVLIGTRSACLLPFKNLKLSVIFQEEDKAYKQEDARPYYHTRSVMCQRAKLTNSKLILVSASPALETLFLAQKGEIKTAIFKDKLPKFNNKAQIIITPKAGKNSKFISDELEQALRQNMLNSKQSLLILNRLGYSGLYACVNCKMPARCKKCGAILSRARINGADTLVCRKCSNKESLNQICPSCKNEIFHSLGGGGTQAVSEDIGKLMPQARVLRLDSQTLATKKSEGHFVAEALANKEVDIVIGTLMAEHVGELSSDISLIAVLDGDSELASPDFRSGETFCQMLFNLKGRLNKVKDGKFIIQMAKSEAFDFTPLKENNYMAFAEAELEFRKEFNFPPYTKLVKIVINSKTKKDLDTYTKIIINAINTAYSAYMQVEGPVQSGVQAKDFHQHYLLIKSLDDAMLNSFIKTLVDNKASKKITTKVLADPYNFIN
jgi:primosomal protein N' (replication factor Y)